ncbi:hypothetical protein NQZ68_007242 [Dissostichus eleginoides]|nr:hypothetical protein NQZ68_007242 [Dissostichus eleginoides]
MPPTSAVRVPPAIHHQLVMSSRCVSYISQALATGAATVTEHSSRLYPRAYVIVTQMTAKPDPSVVFQWLVLDTPPPTFHWLSHS